MKIIHCADLHLDSKMTANLDKEKAKERKAELLLTFEKMIAYAKAHRVEAILIAGDLFDTKNISAGARNVVKSAVLSNPEMTFYYLKGNHDQDNFLAAEEEIPQNLKLFSKEWTSYILGTGRIILTGLELCKENSGSAYATLTLDATKYNIVMLHGQESETGAKDKVEVINLRSLKNKGIDYLALGHIHAYKTEALDARGVYCYPGCLEGRGFDECGEHGFVVLDIDEESGKATREFVPVASRNLYEVPVDVTDCMTSGEMRERICEKLFASQPQERMSERSLVKVILTGTLDVECEKDVQYLVKSFENDFYFIKIYDETTLKVDIHQFMTDMSLKGEFVRKVMEAELSEEEKGAIIRYGLQILEKGEVELCD